MTKEDESTKTPDQIKVKKPEVRTYDQQLSEHFTLREFLFSETAIRKGLQNNPGPIEIENLRRLCETVLEPLRASLGAPLVITSGYRNERLNALVGGSWNSRHILGRAADIVVPGYKPIEVCRRAVDLGLPCSQIIHEYGRWCHIDVVPAGYKQATGRAGLQILTAKFNNGRTVYLNGLVEV